MNASARDRSAGPRTATVGRRREPGTLGREDPATEFAITTVDVPDRLDMREVNDRSMEDEHRQHRGFDWHGMWSWIKRLIWLGVVVALGWFAWQALGPLRESLTPKSIAERLSNALGAPVTVAGTGYSLTPQPRVSISMIEGAGFSVTEASLRLSWGDMWRSLRNGTPTWGEATLAPMSLTPAQALAFIRAVPRLSEGLPTSISTIRIEALELSATPLFPGRFEVVARRDASGKFSAVEAVRVGGDGALRLRFQPAADGTTAFQVDATGWQPEFGPTVKWSELVASGRVLTEPQGFEITQFTANGFYGSLIGQAYITHDVSWAIAGTTRGSSFDIEAILKHLQKSAPAPKTPAAAPVASDSNALTQPQLPLSGTAGFNALLVGGGQTLQEALSRSVLAGPVEVRFGTLNGVNLGFAATRPSSGGGTSGGVTRFTELSSQLQLSTNGVTLDDIRGRAGAMTTQGDLSIGQDLALKGNLRVDLGATRVQAPLNLRVGGTALQPQWGR